MEKYHQKATVEPESPGDDGGNSDETMAAWAAVEVVVGR